MGDDALGEPSGIKLRSYQQEMWQASIEKNIIVAMDTGSGKTHVAIARILTALEQSASDKLVWFLSPSVALSNQQAGVLAETLPAYVVRSLTGSDGVDKWTDQGLWDAALAHVRIVVATPAVLKDALTHGFVDISRLSLLVFDEAHRASKGHPMNAIMQNFYHPAKQRGDQVPHILGLTASPVMSTKTKKGSLEQIEQNLDSVTRSPKEHRAELNTYVNPPQVEIVAYGAGDADGQSIAEPWCTALYEAVRNYDFATDPYIIELKQQDDERSRKELSKVLLKQKTYTTEQLGALEQRMSKITSQLGSSMARWYISTCIAKFRDATRSMSSQTSFMPDLSNTERIRINSIFDSIEGNAGDAASENNALRITLKAERLVRILAQHADASLRGIIFVEQRVMVTVLAHLLAQFPEIAKAYRIASFVGTSGSVHRKVRVADLVDVKDQDHDLNAFRKGEKNLMIATDVLEEGIDVAACNFVMCFDSPKNLISFVQRRGRARQKDSKYFLFASDDDLKKGSKDWTSLEERMKAAYMDETRQAPEHKEDEDMSQLIYRVPKTRALLTGDDAKSHLYHFCSVGMSQASNYVDLRPEFDTDETAAATGKKLWTALVDLPTFVHPDVRHAASSRSWFSETAAIKDAAFQAYVALHKEGLVNDNLLPLVKDYGPKPGQQHLNQPALVQVSERDSSWRHLWHGVDSNAVEWSSYSVAITSQDKHILNAVLWTPNAIPAIEAFDLYWNEKHTYQVAIRPSGNRSRRLGHAERSLLERCTDLLLRMVHGNRMVEAPASLPVLLGLVDSQSTEEWINSYTVSHSAADAGVGKSDPLESGLVNFAGLIGRSFFLQGFETVLGDDESLVEHAVVSAFPKRRDFLHSVPASNMAPAYTARQTFPVSRCTISRLPAKYALLSAFMPSILHRIDTAFLASRLQEDYLQPVGLASSSLVLTAISSPSAGEQSDYNRLEFLGDTILKHHTELQVMSQHTNWPEAYLTAEKDRVVRNDNLAKAALEAGLDKFILTKSFTGNQWRPPNMQELLRQELGSREMSTKVLADVVEALIGAAYMDGGLVKAFVCIKTLLPAETWLAPTECFALLIEDIRPTRYVDLSLLERLVGHNFEHPTLLVEAITHQSFPYNRGGLSYERLEYLGDSVLDMIITAQLFAHSRELKHWELHRIHEVLVNSHILGFFCLKYAVGHEVSDVKQDGEEYVTTKTTRSAHLHDFLRMGQALHQPRQKALTTYQNLAKTIDEALHTGKEYPWCELMSLNLPKFFSDMIESVLGALFVDTRGDLSVCEAFVDKLGLLNLMHRILDDNVECINPKERLGMVADQDVVHYATSKSEDGAVQCLVKVGDEEIVKIGGCGSKEEAEVKAAHQACRVLEARGGYAERAKKRKLDIVMLDETMDIDA